MERRKILINEKEPREVLDLRKALVAAGYDVRIVLNTAETLALLDAYEPDALISEFSMPEMDGARLLQEVREDPHTQHLPFIMVGKLRTVDERVNLMKLPIDDYLQKPFDVDEALARIQNLIKEAEYVTSSPQPKSPGFSGNLAEMNLVDLLQTIEVGKKTCIIKLRSTGREGVVYITEGQVIDAELERLEARQALLRMFTWTDGQFQVELRYHERPRMLTIPNRDLVSEGLTRQYRWGQLASQLPPLNSFIGLAHPTKPAPLDEEEEALVQSLRGHEAKRLLDVVEESATDDLRAMTVLKRLFDRGAIQTMPFPADIKNGDYFGRIKELQSNRANGTHRLDQMLKHMLSLPNQQLQHSHERRRMDRRLQPERRQTDRRRGDPMKKQKVHLNKSELLMLREKLVQL